MKKQNIIISIIILMLSAYQLSAQNEHDFEGKWLGTLEINETVKLNLGFEVNRNNQNAIVSVVHSLDQGAFDIPIECTRIRKDSIIFDIKVMGAFYKGMINENQIIEGSFKQGNGGSIPLNLAKVEEFPVKKALRPQEPQKPYPYSEELVKIENPNAVGITLAGTLTLPTGNGPFPAVILLSGSGPNHRDARIFGHKLFLVMSDYLTRHGIAVLRTDDRGTYESTGDFNSADIKELGSDAVACFLYLLSHKAIDPERIGVLGHSHGASVAPVAATIDNNIAFAILMAGSAETGAENIIEQTEIIYKQNGVSDAGIALNTKLLNNLFNIVSKSTDDELARNEFQDFINDFEKELKELSQEELVKLELTPPISADMIYGFLTSAMKKDLFFEPDEYLSKMTCPTLVLAGSKDVQVPVRHLYLTEELIIQNGNENVTTKEFKGKNHLFQSANTGAVEEYKNIEETISPEVLECISNWIRDLGIDL